MAEMLRQATAFANTSRVDSTLLLPFSNTSRCVCVGKKPLRRVEVSRSRHLSVASRRLRNAFICRSSIGGASADLSPELKTALEAYVKSNKVVLFMKGNRLFPQCGFSNTVVQILNSFNVPYETVNILENEEVRSGMKVYSKWPTFPQLYIDGEFFGGCDITLEAYKNGELQETIEKAMCS